MTEPLPPHEPTKKVDPIIGMVKHPLPKKVYVILGIKCIFSYSFWHLCLFAFTFTYLNIVTLFEFGVYPTLMTGNYFNGALDMRSNRYHDALFRISLIGACTILGTALDCYLLTALQSRHNAFAVHLVLLLISVVVTDFANEATESKYALCILCITGGAMVHWSQKLGYTCSAMTGNLFKLSEFIFKWINGYDMGGPKMHGELCVMIGILFWTIIGAFAAVSATQNESITLYPLLITIPFHLYLSGTLEVWGLIKSNDEEPATKTEKQQTFQMSAVKSPIQPEVASSAEEPEVTQPVDVQSERSSLFDTVSISLDELKEVEDIEKSFGYKTEKALNLSE